MDGDSSSHACGRRGCVDGDAAEGEETPRGVNEEGLLQVGVGEALESRFQSRENKRDQLRELREQFERDKEKIEKMKRNRKFNPTFIVC